MRPRPSGSSTTSQSARSGTRSVASRASTARSSRERLSTSLARASRSTRARARSASARAVSASVRARSASSRAASASARAPLGLGPRRPLGLVQPGALLLGGDALGDVPDEDGEGDGPALLVPDRVDALAPVPSDAAGLGREARELDLRQRLARAQHASGRAPPRRRRDGAARRRPAGRGGRPRAGR